MFFACSVILGMKSMVTCPEGLWIKSTAEPKALIVPYFGTKTHHMKQLVACSLFLCRQMLSMSLDSHRSAPPLSYPAQRTPEPRSPRPIEPSDPGKIPSEVFEFHEGVCMSSGTTLWRQTASVLPMASSAAELFSYRYKAYVHSDLYMSITLLNFAFLLVLKKSDGLPRRYKSAPGLL